MIDAKYTKEMLKLYNNLVLIVNIKKKIIAYATKGENVVGENVEYNKFIDKVVKDNDFDDVTRGKLERFLNNLQVDSKPFLVNANYSKNNGFTTRYIIKGQKISDHEVILSFEDVGKVSNNIEDSLTRLKTKVGIEPYINDAIKNKKEFALIIVCFDKFEEYEQTYGKMLTDIILVEAASSLKKVIGDNGIAARISNHFGKELENKTIVLLILRKRKYPGMKAKGWIKEWENLYLNFLLAP